MASASRQASKHPAQQREPGLIGRTLNLVGQILLWLVAALLFSLIAEWVGMTWIWPDQGIQHSQQMLEREIGYLNEDFRKSMLTSNPADFARSFADMSYRLIFEYTGIHSLVEWLSVPVHPEDGRFAHSLRNGFVAVEPYVLAGMAITQVFALRLGVLTLAMPVFVLFALVALVDGLVQRDLRRWGGGRESSFVYHHAKRLMAPSIAMAWVVYLALPFSVHPNWVILPFALLNAITIAITASSFKKYL
ncbi:TIGR03747 family integrating conjugative element membrane protein [Thioalkalivibrio sp. ALJ2]|uniref:TIGR03747 family integrating conjugative element membrane protein n=1 Tax=Thioalkalivibrio sp. ALJ2 TaxID=1261622 RepID=UPI00037099BA|nr:TIGR03747 family integrating conjugative element membrane protein [Thioalkalivibrio sp. ALJ2]